LIRRAGVPCPLRDQSGKAIEIDDVWASSSVRRSGGANGNPNQLFFTAGNNNYGNGTLALLRLASKSSLPATRNPQTANRKPQPQTATANRPERITLRAVCFCEIVESSRAFNDTWIRRTCMTKRR